MRFRLKKHFLLLFLSILFLTCVNFSQNSITSPKLVFVGTDEVQNGMFSYTIYWLSVENRTEFSDELFEPATDLPPCGKNKNASRSWIEVYSSSEQKLYSFCAIKSSSELNKLSFSLPKGQTLPKFVYITLIDRRTGKKYTSNLTEIKVADKP